MKKGIRVVVQRCEKARLLLDNANHYESIGRGMILFVSFTQEARESRIVPAVETLFSLPIVSLGAWGDGTKPQSFSKLLKAEENVQIMIVPQAGLTCKYKRNSLQYTNQLSKLKAAKLFYQFANAVNERIRTVFVTPPDKAWIPKIPVSPEKVFKTGKAEYQFLCNFRLNYVLKRRLGWAIFSL